MKVAFVLLFSALFGLHATGQTTTGKASTTGTCSQAVTGSHNTFVINCQIDSAQGTQMIEILNKILSNQQKLQPDIVLQKLDEILKNVNPNLPQKTYFCNGQWKTAGPSATAGFAVTMGGDPTFLQQMLDPYNAHKFADTLTSCKAHMESEPEWLTPRLVCGLAYLALGDMNNAKLMLAEYQSRKGPAYDTQPCTQMETFIQQRLP